MAGVDDKIGGEDNEQFDLGDFTVIKEGEAELLIHEKDEFFYNQIEVNIRDMSIAVLRTFISKRKQEHNAIVDTAKAMDVFQLSSKKSQDESTSVSKEKDEGKGDREMIPPRVLEVMSDCGLGALRYAREIDGIGNVVTLENDPLLIKVCRRNIKFNGSLATSKVESLYADARVYMLKNQKQFDVVDLDPFGSPSIFLDSAVQSVVDGGILMCTATDMAVLCGFHNEVCYSKYGSYPVGGKYSHEMALRILLACIESNANRHKRYIVPVLSVQMDFYVRVFVRVYTSASAMKSTPLKLSYVYQCTGCESFHLQPVGRTISKNSRIIRHLPGFGPVVSQECGDCGKQYNMGGPIWCAPIHDLEWVTSILEDVESNQDRYPAFNRIFPVLTKISEELLDVPLFVCVPDLAATLKCIPLSAAKFRSAVISAGYRASGTHVNPLGTKTDAPMDVIWDVMRCWVKKHPAKKLKPGEPGSVILAKEPALQVSF